METRNVPCSVVGCTGDARSRGLCMGHYLRLRRHGDVQADKPLRKTVPRRLSDTERFWAKVTKGDGCWLWNGSIASTGYGVFHAGRQHLAHRYMHELVSGPIPDGFQIDHLCRNPACVNPAHLEAVPPRTNYLRGVGAAAQNARKTHCKRGHEFTPENTFPQRNGARGCRECRRMLKRERRLGLR